MNDPVKFTYDNITIDESAKTPLITLNKNGLIEIAGRCLPENPRRFYETTSLWIDEYSKNPSEKTEVTFKFNYINSSSTVIIFGLIKQMEEILLKKTELIFNWYFENDDGDMQDLGIYFSNNCIAKFNIIEIDVL